MTELTLGSAQCQEVQEGAQAQGLALVWSQLRAEHQEKSTYNFGTCEKVRATLGQIVCQILSPTLGK